MSSFSDEPTVHQQMFKINEPVVIADGEFKNYKGVIIKIALKYSVLLENGVHVKKTEQELQSLMKEN